MFLTFHRHGTPFIHHAKSCKTHVNLRKHKRFMVNQPLMLRTTYWTNACRNLIIWTFHSRHFWIVKAGTWVTNNGKDGTNPVSIQVNPNEAFINIITRVCLWQGKMCAATRVLKYSLAFFLSHAIMSQLKKLPRRLTNCLSWTCGHNTHFNFE